MDLIASLLGGGPYVRRIAMESADFVLLPSLGALNEGHMLLCPKPHDTSIAAVPAERRAALMQFKMEAAARLRDVFGLPLHIFEHGAGRTSGTVPCSTDHAHLHMVPLPHDVETEFLVQDGWVPSAPIEADVLIAPEAEYIYYELPDGRAFLRKSTGRPFPSQLMRRLLSRALGKEGEWDWRADPRADLAHRDFARVVGNI